MKHINEAFWIFHIRKVKLKMILAKTRNIRSRRRIMILCYTLQCRIDNITAFTGGALPNFNIFQTMPPVWG